MLKLCLLSHFGSIHVDTYSRLEQLNNLTADFAKDKALRHIAHSVSAKDTSSQAIYILAHLFFHLSFHATHRRIHCESNKYNYREFNLY